MTMDSPLITAGLSLPSFSEDLSTWQIKIYPDGLLVQEVHEATLQNLYSGELRRETSRVASSDLADILETAERVGFWCLEEEILSTLWDFTDLKTVFISIASRVPVKTVQVYGATVISIQDPIWEQLRRFVELWEKILKNAPLPHGKSLSLVRLEETIDDLRQPRDRQTDIAWIQPFVYFAALSLAAFVGSESARSSLALSSGFGGVGSFLLCIFRQGFSTWEVFVLLMSAAGMLVSAAILCLSTRIPVYQAKAKAVNSLNQQAESWRTKWIRIRIAEIRPDGKTTENPTTGSPR